MEYCSAVVRHFDAPVRAGELPHGLSGLVTGEAEDRTLHVWVRFELQVVDGVIRRARFQAFGCPHTVAAASVAADWLEGRAVAAARGFDALAVATELGVPAEKRGKLLRIDDAVAACWQGLE